MHNQVLIIGLLVGSVNFLFRYLPLCFKSRQMTGEDRGIIGVLLDTIGIASVCALLVVSSAPDILHHPHHLFPVLAGFATLTGCFLKTRSIVLPTLVSAVAYGLVWKLMTLL